MDIPGWVGVKPDRSCINWKETRIRYTVIDVRIRRGLNCNSETLAPKDMERKTGWKKMRGKTKKKVDGECGRGYERTGSKRTEEENTRKKRMG